MLVSIIIVNYNTKALLKQCLESVIEKTQDIEYEIIVVDNASSDGSQSMVNAEFSQVKLIGSPENLGFGGANNLGATIAQGKYLFFLNSDTILINNAVKILADFMEQTPKCGICGGNLFDENLMPVHSFLDIDTLLMEIKDFLHIGIKKFNITTKPIKVGRITGADLMIKTEFFNKLKGFDPIFFMYSEDADLNYRARKNNYQIYNVPQSNIIHLENKSSNNENLRTQRLLDGKRKYYAKHYGKLYKNIALTIILTTAISRMLLLKNTDIRKEHWKFIARNIFRK
ncbi:glycosyl transferase [Bacteroidia bacterium]|nr:glycosyl transferase [Bacteroidia bacterium]